MTIDCTKPKNHLSIVGVCHSIADWLMCRTLNSDEYGALQFGGRCGKGGVVWCEFRGSEDESCHAGLGWGSPFMDVVTSSWSW